MTIFGILVKGSVAGTGIYMVTANDLWGKDDVGYKSLMSLKEIASPSYKSVVDQLPEVNVPSAKYLSDSSIDKWNSGVKYFFNGLIDLPNKLENLISQTSDKSK